MGKYYFRSERQQKIRLDNFENRFSNPQQKKLMSEALTYEEQYFKDMTMQSKSIQEHYMCHMENDGEIVKTNYGDPPYISICDWKIVEKKLRNRIGFCYPRDLEIAIKQGLSPRERKLTFLHEMIHAYEAELRFQHANSKELILIFLYKNLIKRLGEKKANSFLKTASKSIFWVSSHSILFTLKSLDLDIRLKLPFGSVFCYGREDWFPKNKDKVK